MSDDHRTTPGAGGGGHITGVGFAPFNNDAPKPAATIPEQAVEAIAHRLMNEFDMRAGFGASKCQNVAREIVESLPSLVGVQRPEDVAAFTNAADALRASLPDHWHDDAVTEFDDARAAMNKQQLKSEKCAACGREPALFYNCFRQRQDCPQRALPHTGQPQEGLSEGTLTAALAGLPDRLDRLCLKASDDERFILHIDSARNIVEITREWLRGRLSADPASPRAEGE